MKTSNSNIIKRQYSKPINQACLKKKSNCQHVMKYYSDIDDQAETTLWVHPIHLKT